MYTVTTSAATEVLIAVCPPGPRRKQSAFQGQTRANTVEYRDSGDADEAGCSGIGRRGEKRWTGRDQPRQCESLSFRWSSARTIAIDAADTSPVAANSSGAWKAIGERAHDVAHAADPREHFDHEDPQQAEHDAEPLDGDQLAARGRHVS